MEAVIAFGQTYADGLILLVELLMVLLICILIHRINLTKRKIDKVSAAVEGYLAIIMKEEVQGAEPAANSEDSVESARILKQQKEEEQNSLISAVLQEIFP